MPRWHCLRLWPMCYRRVQGLSEPAQQVLRAAAVADAGCRVGVSPEVVRRPEEEALERGLRGAIGAACCCTTRLERMGFGMP